VADEGLKADVVAFNYDRLAETGPGQGLKGPGLKGS